MANICQYMKKRYLLVPVVSLVINSDRRILEDRGRLIRYGLTHAFSKNALGVRHFLGKSFKGFKENDISQLQGKNTASMYAKLCAL